MVLPARSHAHLFLPPFSDARSRPCVLLLESATDPMDELLENSTRVTVQSRMSAYLLFFRVVLSIDVHTRVDISLRAVTEIFVLRKDLMIKDINLLKLFVRRILVSVDFILDFACRCCHRYHSLYVEHVFAVGGCQQKLRLALRPRGERHT